VQLLQLAAAYGAFANGGLRVDPVLVARIETADGRLLYEAPGPDRQRVLDERVAWLVSDVLADPAARLPAFGSSSPLNTAFGAAVKTGTTTEWRDNWTVGYTRDMVVGVWVGNADNASMEQISGVTGAAPIWQGVMASLHPEAPQPFVRPEGLVERTVCADSGFLPGPACPRLRDEWFLPGNAPQEACTMHRLEELDAATGRLASASTPPERRVLRRVTYWPADALLWAEHAGLPLPPEPADGEAAAWAAGDPVAGAAATGAAEPHEARPRLASPVSGSTYCLAADIAPRYQQVEIVAVGPIGVALARLTLEVDGAAVHRWAGAPYRAFWPLAPGAHVLRVVGVTRDGTEIYSEPVQIMVRDACD
jgi:membrane peptidoglycan carboxypeptidase